MNMIHSTDSAFVKVMGQVRPWLSLSLSLSEVLVLTLHATTQSTILETFNKYFPIIVLLICLATLFRVYQRALEFFDAPQFQVSNYMSPIC